MCRIEHKFTVGNTGFDKTGINTGLKIYRIENLFCKREKAVIDIDNLLLYGIDHKPCDIL